MVPPDVIEEIDITKGATSEFIGLIADLETTLNFNVRAEKAKSYIDANDGLKEIFYDELGLYLANPLNASLET